MKEKSKGGLFKIKNEINEDVGEFDFKTMSFRIKSDPDGTKESSTVLEKNIGKFACYICDFQTSLKPNLVKHIRILHVQSNELCCPHCSYKTNDKEELQNHVKNAHDQSRTYTCPPCNFKTTEKDELSTHIRKQHKTPQPRQHSLDGRGPIFRNGSLGEPLSSHSTTRGMIILKNAEEARQTPVFSKSSFSEESKRQNNFKEILIAYTCDYCEYRSTQKGGLEEHIRNQHKIVFPCNQCPFDSVDAQALRRHQQESHSRKGLQDDRAPMSPSDVHGKTERREDQQKSNNEFCSQCEFKSSSSMSMKSHIEQFHDGIDVRVFCLRCNYSSTDNGTMEKHHHLVHSESAVEKRLLCQFDINKKLSVKLTRLALEFCLQCEFRTQSRADLVKHITREHGPIIASPYHQNASAIPSDIVPHTAKETVSNGVDRTSVAVTNFMRTQLTSIKCCRECSYKTQDIEYLKMHVSTVHSTESISPRISPNPTAHSVTAASMANEEQTLHDMESVNEDVSTDLNQTFACPHCPYQATTKCNVNNHVKGVHQKIKDQSCHLCPFETTMKSNLSRHIQSVHEKVKHYTCPQEGCDYESFYSTHLALHEKSTHAKIKDVSCDKCDFKTATDGNLKMHIKAVHDKIRDKLCDFCEYETSVTSDLKLHIKAVHLQIKDLSCTQCNYETSYPSHLHKHIRMVHEKNSPDEKE